MFFTAVPSYLEYWSYLHQWKPSYTRLTSKRAVVQKGRHQETRAEAKLTTHMVCLTHTNRVKAVYWTGAVYSYRNMRDGEQRTRLHLNSNGSARVVNFDLARPPPFYTATSRKLPRTIANARWISRTLHLRPTSSFKCIGNVLNQSIPELHTRSNNRGRY